MYPSDNVSRLVSGRYPEPGTNPIADAIRERRGPTRGLTELDGNLLHTPRIAQGYNELLGAIRSGGKLPGDVREAMILRIAALNHAAYEWVQHVDIGRKEGLSTGQLYAIRDINTPLLLPSPGIGDGTRKAGVFTPLQVLALEFTDHSTRNAYVPLDLCERLKGEIGNWLSSLGDTNEDERQAKVEDHYVEAVMVVATYNMVSRFLLATDVAGLAGTEVPWPVERKEHFVAIPSFPPAKPTHEIHAVTLITSSSAPWIVFANSLLTDWSMWGRVIPFFLDLPSTPSSPLHEEGNRTTYNILLHSQRGHGRSTLPLATEGQERLTTIPLLASDIAHLLSALNISTPVQSVIGVSQGGAAALAFSAMYGAKTRSIVSCDTAPRTPAGNKEAWEDRIRLVFGSAGGADADRDAYAYARYMGMHKLAGVTVPRWFPEGSLCHPDPTANGGRELHSSSNRIPNWVKGMIEETDPDGFLHGARALGSYDLLELAQDEHQMKRLYDSQVEKVLLLAGTLDGGGKVFVGLRALSEDWNRTLGAGSNHDLSSLSRVTFVGLEKAGHLPMIDSSEAFCEAVAQFFNSM